MYAGYLVNLIQRVASGGVFDAITTATFESMEVIIPTKDVEALFTIYSQSIFEKIFNNSLQIQSLSTLRDTLLPKLMRGEIQIK